MPAPRTEPARANDGWLSRPEQLALDWIAPKIPPWLTPGRLTALGFAGAVAGLIGYALAASAPAALWLVNAALIVNWFGDSLDGKMARLRGIERPDYGFFLDQSVDVVAQFLFALGLALSGYMRPEIVAFGFGVYLMMSIQGLLRAQVSGVLHLAAGGFGLTEIRCLFLFANAAYYFVPPRRYDIDGIVFAYPDILGLTWIVANLGLYLLSMRQELSALKRRAVAPGARDRHHPENAKRPPE